MKAFFLLIVCAVGEETAAPTCGPSGELVLPFELVGGSSALFRGWYSVDGLCGCRGFFRKADTSIYFDDWLKFWVATTSGCGVRSADALVAPADVSSPLEIGTSWFEPVNGAFAENATLEVRYAIEVTGTLLSAENEAALGVYERKGLCDGRPFFAKTDSYLYYLSAFDAWAISHVGCGSDFVEFYVFSTAFSPLSIDATWYEAVETFATNPTVSISFVEATEPPSISSPPSMSPPPSVSPPPSTAVPTVDPPSSIEYDDCDESESWTCVAFDTARTTDALFRYDRSLLASGSLVKDQVCANHRLFISQSPIESYAAFVNLAGAVQLSWECDEFVLSGATGGLSRTSCPADTYRVDVQFDATSVTATATGTQNNACRASIDHGLLDAALSSTSSFFLYVGGDWSWLKMTEFIDEATPFPTVLATTSSTTSAPSPAFKEFQDLSCGFDDDTFCQGSWVSGALGTRGFIPSTISLPSTPETGPSAPYEGLGYAYVDATEANAGPLVLSTRRFVALQAPAFLVFRYHMYGANMGTLAVEYETDSDDTSGGAWIEAWSRSGDMLDAWHDGVAEIPANTVRVRFVAFTGDGLLSDAAVDAVVATVARPTPSPSSRPSVSPAPSSSFQPSASFKPTAQPTGVPVVTTRAEIRNAILAGQDVVWLDDSVVDFSDGGVVVVSERDVVVASIDADAPAICDGAYATRLFAVVDVELELRDLVLRNGYTDNLGGAVVAISGSRLILTRCVLEHSLSLIYGGCLFAEDSSWVFASETIFANCSATGSGGAIGVWEDATLVLSDDTVVADSISYEGFGGGLFLQSGAHLLASRTSFLNNRAINGTGGAAIFHGSTADLDDCVFRYNEALNGGALLATASSVIAVSNNVVHRNTARLSGGGLLVESSASVHVDTSVFSENSVLGDIFDDSIKIAGGAVQAITSGSFSSRSSIFRNNTAPEGGAVSLDSSGVASLSQSWFLGNDASSSASRWISCATRSTLYVARITIDGAHTVSAETCSGYVYQVNDDGTPEYAGDTVETSILVEPGFLALATHTYPCDPGKYSEDGLEHGDETDRNGLTVDENDPGCTPGCSNAYCRCATPCETCPSGRYLPFTLDKFRLTNVDSCQECPVGRFLADDGLDASLHDALEDCELCPAGRYTDVVGSSSCESCAPGTFAADEGSTFCATAPGGAFVNVSGATQPTPCPPGRFGVGGATECTECESGTYQSETGQTACSVVSPGYFAFESAAVDQERCDPGTFSGSGASECTPCAVGRFNPHPGQTECFLASPGSFVNETGSTGARLCGIGEFAGGAGQPSCDPCPVRIIEDRRSVTVRFTQVGSYCEGRGRESTQQCPYPTTTSGEGMTYCDGEET